ncbi:MAG: alpha/beta hydrolase, partial [Woeseiaceae bacterium]
MSVKLTTRESLVWVEGPTGRLFGILHRPPAASDASVCVIMLNAGVQNRTGPERLYVRVARRFARAGVSVLRADLSGCGDSASENREAHFDAHRVADVDAFVRYAADTLHPRTLLLQGLCAGARVALKAADRNGSVDGVLAWSTTIYTATRSMPRSPESPSDGLSSTVVTENRKRLLRFVLQAKFLNPVWWRKRLTTERSLFDDAREIWRSFPAARRASAAERGATTFLDATDRYLANDRKVLFLYGSRDRTPLKEFFERFPQVGTNLRNNQC